MAVLHCTEAVEALKQLRHSSDEHMKRSVSFTHFSLFVVITYLQLMCCRRKRKKRSEETQTLRAGCSKAEPLGAINFRPTADPLLVGTGRPKFNQLEKVTTFTYRPSLVKIVHAISSYHSNRPTNKHTNRQDRLQYTVPLSLVHSVTMLPR